MSLLNPTDLRDHARTQMLVQKVRTRYGCLDILVNLYY
jgi:NADP-dependent 3-hydroxy acid dehydrogenase YdfG